MSLTVFAAVVNSEKNEGRGHDINLAMFTTPEAAKEAGKGQDVMGTDGRVAELIVFDSVEDYKKQFRNY